MPEALTIMAASKPLPALPSYREDYPEEHRKHTPTLEPIIEVEEPYDIKMDPTRLAPESIDGEKKQQAIQDAKDMYQAVQRICERSNHKVPPFDFLELIGKGASGRVYKCRDRNSGELVAVKIINTDSVDYGQDTLDKDDTIRDYLKEVNTLQQLKDAKAKNINMIKEAFDLQEQLWIVCEYCTGGSVRTLMRANPPSRPGLEEEYIIPIARELAVAIKNVHDIGVLHRDIKCTNVYITEAGEIQLGDFGIVGVLDDEGSKRRTIIGTPHYMSREMVDAATKGNQAPEGYGKEVDIWSFGCTIYEMATGLPPNATKPQRYLNRALQKAPRLGGGDYSDELRDFVAYCLNLDPEQRPTADEVLQHPYIANTQKRYPTRNLVKLIQRFKAWEYGGGWRQSLFMAGGAPPVPGSSEDPRSADQEEFDDWNFSTSDVFNADFSRRYSQMMDAQSIAGLQLDTAGPPELHPIITEGLTPMEKAYQESSANRGERSLERLWNPDSAPYELHTAVDDLPPMQDDLPLRRMTESAPTRESMVVIDLDSAGEIDTGAPAFNFDFGDIPTVKAKSSRAAHAEEEEEEEFQYSQTQEDRDHRATIDWKFPTAKRATMDWTFPTQAPTEPENPDLQMSLPPIGDAGELAPMFRPTLKHTATVPLGQFGDYIHPQPFGPSSSALTRDSVASMIDLDMGLVDSSDIPPRPSTATSLTGSTMTDLTSGNPFDLEEDPEQNEADQKRFSHHKQWQSEGGQARRSQRRSIPMHARGSSLSSGTDDDYDRPSGGEEDVFTYEYNRRLSQSIGRGGFLNGIDSSSIDLNAWPTFDPALGYDRVRNYHDDLDDMIANDRASRVVGAPPAIEIARTAAPDPAALLEDADPEVVEAELSRLLSGVESSLSGLRQALQERLAELSDGDEEEGGEEGGNGV